MAGITSREIEQFIHIKLLTLISTHIKASFTCGQRRLLADIAQRPKNEELDDLILRLGRLRNTSDLIFAKITAWSEDNLLGERTRSSDLKLQAEIILQIMRSRENERLVFKNSVKNTAFCSIHMSLFRVVLTTLLEFILQFDANQNLHVYSDTGEGCVKISIAGFNGHTLHIPEGQLALVPGISEENMRLILCYDILTLYDGNLWSQNISEEGLILHFSLPCTNLST
jgi:hypothetical protein